MKRKRLLGSANYVFIMLFLANGFSNFVQFVASLLLARQLGPEQFGIFSFYVSFAQTLSLLVDLGLCLTMVRLASGEANDTNRQKLISVTMAFQLILYVVIALSLSGASGAVFQFFPHAANQQVMYALAVGLAGAIAIQLVLKSIMQVYQSLVMLASFTLLYAVLRSLFFLGAYREAGASQADYFSALYLSPLICSCVVFAVVLGWSYRKARVSGPTSKPKSEAGVVLTLPSAGRELFNYGKWMLAQPLYTLLFLIPMFVLARVSATELGFYSAAFAFAAIFTLINTSVRQITMPMVSRFTSSAEINNYMQQVRAKCVIAIPAIIIIILAMGALMLFVLDERYRSAYPVFCILGGGMAATMLLGQFNIVSHVFRRPDLLMYMTIAQLLLVSLLCIATTQWLSLGALGAASSVAISLFAGEVWLFFKIRGLSNVAF